MKEYPLETGNESTHKTFEPTSYKNMIRDYVDDLESLTDEEIYKQVNSLIESEYESTGIHPSCYPLRYLNDGILFDYNWEDLVDKDIDKFVVCYGLDLKLTREDKIIEIIRSQNDVLDELIKHGYTGICRGCKRYTKLIQKIEEKNIIIDGRY